MTTVSYISALAVNSYYCQQVPAKADPDKMANAIVRRLTFAGLAMLVVVTMTSSVQAKADAIRSSESPVSGLTKLSADRHELVSSQHSRDDSFVNHSENDFRPEMKRHDGAAAFKGEPETMNFMKLDDQVNQHLAMLEGDVSRRRRDLRRSTIWNALPDSTIYERTQQRPGVDMEHQMIDYRMDAHQPNAGYKRSAVSTGGRKQSLKFTNDDYEDDVVKYGDSQQIPAIHQNSDEPDLYDDSNDEDELPTGSSSGSLWYCLVRVF